MSSETITRNDLTNILNEIVAIDGTDMTSQEIEDFVDSLNVVGGGIIIGSNYIKIGSFGACWGNADMPSISAAPNGTETIEFTFPITFANVPFVVPFVSAGFGGARGVVAYADPSIQTTTKGTIRVNNVVGSAITGATNGVGWLAIGSV